MTDPGHPFVQSFETLVGNLQDSLLAGVERTGEWAFPFTETVLGYDLPPDTTAVTQVSALVDGRFTVFDDTDYQLLGTRLTWRTATAGAGHPPRHPDDGARVTVDYTYRQPAAGLTDLNPGSVVGTLVRSFARELGLAYAQVDEAYRRAFLDVATGVALDNVVALLGVTRNPAVPASGYLTFSRRAAGDASLVPAGTRATDAGGRGYVTTADVTLGGSLNELGTPDGTTVRTVNTIGRLTSVAPQRTPDVHLETTDTAPRQPYGLDGRTITLVSAVSAGETLQVVYQPTSIGAAVVAEMPGPQGNADAGAVTIMPTPPRGVDGVVNEQPLTGGLSAEDDDRLRERARHALIRAGNGTLDALKFAVLGIDGVDDVQVIDHTRDPDVQLGEVRVRYSSAAGDAAREAATRVAVASVVDQTRPAGILAQIEQITPVFISGSFVVVLGSSASAGVAGELLSGVSGAIAATGIGQALSPRRLSALALRTDGVLEVVEAQLRYRKQDDAQPPDVVEGDVSDPFLVSPNEQVQPDPGQLSVLVVSALHVADSAASGSDWNLDVELLGPGGALHLRDVRLTVVVDIRAVVLRTPDQPPARIGRVTKVLTFSDSTVAALPLTRATDLGGFDPQLYDPTLQLLISAAGYDSVGSATSSIDVA